MIYSKYKTFIEQNSGCEKSISPKTGRIVSPQRVKRGPKIFSAVVRYFSD